MTATILGANVSPFVRKVRVYMTEKGLPYTLQPVSPFSPPEGFREVSPLGKIPAFTDGEVSLADSSVICIYLERCHPEPALYPRGNADYAHALWLEEYIDSGFMPKAGPEVFRPLVLGPKMSKEPVSEEVRAAAMAVVDEHLRPMWQYLESQLGDAEFFVGDALSIADITVASAHVNLWHAGVDVDKSAFPRLAAFIERLFARPSFKTVLDEEAPTWSQRGN